MKNFISLILAFGVLLVTTTTAFAQQGIPKDLTRTQISISRSGQPGIIQVSKQGKLHKARFMNCKIDWKNEKIFYEFSSAQDRFAVSKELFDYVFAETKRDWQWTMGDLSEAHSICTVIYLK